MEATVSYLLKLQQYINLKQKNPEIKYYTLYLGNISKDFTSNNIKRTGFKGILNFFLFILILLILTIF